MSKKLFVCLLLLLSQAKTTLANEIKITKIVNKSDNLIRLTGSLLVPTELDDVAPNEELNSPNYSRLDEKIIYIESSPESADKSKIIHRIFYKDSWIQDE